MSTMISMARSLRSNPTALVLLTHCFRGVSIRSRGWDRANELTNERRNDGGHTTTNESCMRWGERQITKMNGYLRERQFDGRTNEQKGHLVRSMLDGFLACRADRVLLQFPHCASISC